jgi:methionyl-tRNA synthetase
MTEPFYITTPIYYVNDRPHLGHVYTTVVADVVARFHRLAGEPTFFLTGVDEHAAKVADKAAEHGLSPQQWADQNAEAFRETFDKLELTYDDFVRTSSDRHKQKVTQYVAALIAGGDVYPGQYEGWYDPGEEEYVPENRAKDTDYKSPVSGRPLVRKQETNYFFKLSAYRDALLAHFESHPGFVQPAARRNEIVNRIKEAEDVPISRTGSGGWGIPVPGDDEQSIYVWIDALFNYLTYVDDDKRRRFWDSGATHVIAKDILWFHAAIWPALLLALKKTDGHEWVGLPERVYCHSYWVSDRGEKMSKSLGNFLDPAAIDNYVSEFGLDALRWFLATRGPLGTTDSTFSPDLFIEVYNSDLANTFGNSVSRVTNMIGKYCGGMNRGPATNGLNLFQPFSEAELGIYMEAMKRLELEIASSRALRLVRHVDEYIEQTRPFTLAKDSANAERVAGILGDCLEALRVASLLLWPFVPDACEAFWGRIGCGLYAEALADRGCGDLHQWARWEQLGQGKPVQKGPALFPRYDAAKA